MAQAVTRPRDPQHPPTDQPRRRKLRKRTRTRGHGTLNYCDIDQVQNVDIKSLDIDDRSIRREFGKLGQLPCPFRIYKVLNFEIPRWDISYSKSIKIRPGTYQLKLFLTYPFYKRMLGAMFSKSVDVRVSIINSRNGFAKYDLPHQLNLHSVETSSSFHISEEDCVDGFTSMDIRLVSNCSVRKLQVQAILFKANSR